MSDVETRTPRAPLRTERVKPPSVLIVLVVRDGARWLRQCLVALSRQTHPRVGVLAVDNGSTDGSLELLHEALGPDRVLRLGRNVGFPGSVAQALRSSAAQQADYFLLMHDDTILAPDGLSALVEAAERIDGAGIVGPKVMDWNEPRVLLDIGQSTDRFGYPYSPLEDGEIDQGQYDRVREVLYVSSCAMLISRAAWSGAGPPDERLDRGYANLDFCWRTRLAGFRVLMTPQAVARHLSAGSKGEREGEAARSRIRYHLERAALASLLKNYGLLTLLWLLPLYLIQGALRVVLLVTSRRFEDAYQVLAAWGWNVAHLPGTVKRRVRAQAVRAVRDRDVSRYMAPAGIRLRRWAGAAGQAILPGQAVEEGRPSGPARVRLARFVADHPVLTAWVLAAACMAVAYRHLLGPVGVFGGGMARFPTSASAFFAELFSGVQHTGLGGAQPASPALALLGLGSLVTFASPHLLQKILLLGLPLAAAVGCYRTVRATTGSSLAGVGSAACYSFSATTLWALSEGRIPVLILLAGLPWLVRKLWQPFDPSRRTGSLRWLVGAALGLAVLTCFYPGAALAAAVLLVAGVVVPSSATTRRAEGALVLGAVAGALLLALPVTTGMIRSGGQSLADSGGVASFLSVARLSPGQAPGGWIVAFFLPVAGALALLLVSRPFAGTAGRLVVAIILSIYLAWFAAAGYLPASMSNAVAYMSVAAVASAFLVGFGLVRVLEGFSKEAFGLPQLAAALLSLLLLVGLGGQVYQAARGAWAVGGPDRIPAAYPTVSQAGGPNFRVLWLGKRFGDAFQPPGGLPDGTVAAGSASVRFAVTDTSGASALSTGRAAAGPGYEALRTTLSQILAGTTRHGGAALGTLAIRFIVARPGDLGGAAVDRIHDQLDLDRVPTQGMIIFENARAFPLAASIADPEWSRAARSSLTTSAISLRQPGAVQLEGEGARFVGRTGREQSLVLISQQFDSKWRLVPAGRPPIGAERAFGWAIGFRAVPAGTRFEVRFEGQTVRNVEVLLLGALWLAALWITRRPVRGV